MARIRTVKPEFFANEQVAGVLFQWRLLFIGLWTQADRDGRLQDRPKRLKALLFPYDDLDVNDGLESLNRVGLITRYEGNGMKLIAIPTWSKHQMPHQRETHSVLPPPPSSTTKAVPEHNLGLLEGKGKEQEGNSTKDDALRARFDVFWQAYPRKVGKDAAWKEWKRRDPTAEMLELMLATVAAQVLSAQWRKDNGQYIPHPRTWLNQGRWQDEVMPSSLSAVLRLEWDCPHVQRCDNRDKCRQSTMLGRPERAKEAS